MRCLHRVVGSRVGGGLLVAVLALLCLGIPAWDAEAQSVTTGLRAGVLLGEFTAFGELFLTPSISLSAGVGIQSASFTLSTWGTVYLTRSTGALAPYLGLGTKFLIGGGRFQTFLMVLGGLRVNPPFASFMSVFTDLALFVRLPRFDRAALDVRFALAVRF